MTTCEHLGSEDKPLSDCTRVLPLEWALADIGRAIIYVQRVIYDLEQFDLPKYQRKMPFLKLQTRMYRAKRELVAMKGVLRLLIAKYGKRATDENGDQAATPDKE